MSSNLPKSGLPNQSISATIVLGIKLEEKTRFFQLLFCCTAIFSGFLINGICEEFVYRKLQFSYAWYFTMLQCIIYIILAYLQGARPVKASHLWRACLPVAFVWVGSIGLTKASLRYINYPVQIMFKSAKVIPVMIMGAFIPGLRRTYSSSEYLTAMALVVGLVIFTLADVSITPTFEIVGLIMIMGALLFDAFLGNLQEALFVSNPTATQEEVMFYTNVAGIPFILFPMVATGEMWVGWQSGLQYPTVYLILGCAAVATYVGQLAVLALIALFGAASAYMVTSLRKAFTLCVSYIIFTKPFNIDHLVGIGLIFLALSLKLCHKPQAKCSLVKSDAASLPVDTREKELPEAYSLDMGTISDQDSKDTRKLHELERNFLEH